MREQRKQTHNKITQQAVTFEWFSSVSFMIGAQYLCWMYSHSPATQSPDVKDLGAVLESLFCIAPNKNLRARGQAARCQPCGIPIEASCAARARGGEAYLRLGALILASSRDRCLRWLQHCAARPALPTHCHTCTSRQGFRAARRAGRAGEAYRHSDDGVDRLNHRHGWKTAGRK